MPENSSWTISKSRYIYTANYKDKDRRLYVCKDKQGKEINGPSFVLLEWIFTL